MINSMLLIGLILFTSTLIFKNSAPQQILEVVKRLDMAFVLCAVVSMGTYLFLEACMLDVLVNFKRRITPFSVSIKSMFVGQFYSLITPFASGGQPMQLISMVKDGVKATHSTAVLLNKFLYFQIGVTVFSLFLVALEWSNILVYLTKSYGLIAIGLIFNVIGLGVLLLMVFKPSFVKTITCRLLGALRILKVSELKIKTKQMKYVETIDEFTHKTRCLFVDKKVVMKMSLMTLMQLTAYFGMTYFVYRAFGQQDKSFVEILALQSVLYMSISLIPTPGSTGVAEGGFFIIFNSLFPPGTVAGGVLVWRGISYYLNLLVSGLATLYITGKNSFDANANKQIHLINRKVAS
ncbi:MULTISPECIES: lysylphosphatidylglycerol synthase transmembrane domain-containing protein [unclassified Fusibacter]|uniref:lysylphosphatidylglycerol synthase transmembrane domain-containing protein n=1 Tax=unclassified Fusibacter TaxID=2624464 RepID=UPI0010130FCA|nr:lysylphosphatidylglycerol synthase transmembrane domain-containing protein [Fusibacter sp. A1]MCK8059978.1 flippase-like domain-containing protein [Fusibacter sp. A2]NPE22118.1 flippase-like domain-containing protein [Fusibacter sp. A1]